jgi:pilus assembly protein CpaF
MARQTESHDIGANRMDALSELRGRLHFKVVEELGPTLYDRGMSDAELRLRVIEMLEWAVDQEQGLPLTSADRRALLNEIASDVLGYGPIDPLLNDPEITEVMANGPYDIYYERSGKIIRSDVRFVDEVHLRRIIDKIVGQIGRRVDEATPMVDARLPDGSRVNAIIHPLAIGGPYLTIRKFAVDPFQEADLISFGTLTQRVADFLRACVRGRLNIVISGGTGSGKTTTLNVVSAYIPGDERIITVEDAAELQLHQEHVLTLESRPANIEGQGQVAIRDLVRNTLRMRPDRIVVGEVRGAEALDMLQAMNTGHDGSLTTVHSNGPRDTLSRIETMVLMAGFDLPVRAIREQVSSALDLIVHVARLRDGTRRVTHVTEVEGMEGDIITLQDLFLFDYGMGVDDEGIYKGRLKATGIRPSFSEDLENQGIRLPADLFDPEPFARR